MNKRHFIYFFFLLCLCAVIEKNKNLETSHVSEICRIETQIAFN